jgi:hypothetical protein
MSTKEKQGNEKKAHPPRRAKLDPQNSVQFPQGRGLYDY